MHQTILGLTSDAWTAIAAAAQALAAIGALALLVITWMSQRDARDAIDASRRLALHTEALVAAEREGQLLASLPVMEVVYEPHNSRLKLVNKGNGPLLAPRLSVEGTELQLVSQDDPHSAYIQAAAIAVSREAYALLMHNATPSGELRIDGLTLTGHAFSAVVDCGGFGGRGALVARSTHHAIGKGVASGYVSNGSGATAGAHTA